MGRIVVGVDGSRDSEAALRWAAAEAALSGDSLVIVHALHTPVAAVPFSGGIVLPPTDELRAYGNDLLSASAALVRDELAGHELRAELVVQPPVPALLAAAEKATMIVLGSRGLGAFGSTFLGSVSTRVAARSGCPTVVVHAGVQPGDDGPIVVGIDGSLQSDAALRFALDEAGRRDTTVEAVYAYHGPAPVPDQHHRHHHPHDDHDDAGTDHEPWTPEREAAEHHVNTILRRHLDHVPPGVRLTARVSPIDPAEALIAASDGAGLTVVGSRGRGAFRGMLLGSVSQRLLHRACSPVAVVHEGAKDELA